MRESLSEVLSNQGYYSAPFCEGLAALAFISERERSVGLIFSGIQMPGMGGLDFLRTAKAIFPSVPVIMLSRVWDPDLAAEALRGGADDYLLKPPAPADIIALARKHLPAPGRPGHSEGPGRTFDPGLVDVFAGLPDEMLIRVKEAFPEAPLAEEGVVSCSPAAGRRSCSQPFSEIETERLRAGDR
jgi:CheY-like chemotaxis protein